MTVQVGPPGGLASSLNVFGVFAAGMGLGASLIIAIGAQNAYVLRQGLRREHVGQSVLICALVDIVLIALGVGGMGVLLGHLPKLLMLIRWAGVAFLAV